MHQDRRNGRRDGDRIRVGVDVKYDNAFQLDPDLFTLEEDGIGVIVLPIRTKGDDMAQIREFGSEGTELGSEGRSAKSDGSPLVLAKGMGFLMRRNGIAVEGPDSVAEDSMSFLLGQPDNLVTAT